MRACPNCGNQVSENAVFCDQCGSKLPAEAPAVQEQVAAPPIGGVPEGIVICPGCGAENVPGEIFCDVCGEPLETPAPAAVEQVVVEEVVVEEVVEEEIEEEPVPEAMVVEETVVDEAILEQAVVEQAVDELYCSVCGSVISAGDTFCGNCGAALGEVENEPVILEEEALLEEIVHEEAVLEPEMVIEEPVIEDAIVEEAIVEEVIIEEPIVEEPVIEELVAEESIVEVPIVEETVFEEPVIQETVLEEIEAPPPAPVAQPLNCSVCGAVVQPGQVFCASCGAALQVPEPEVQVEAEVVAAGPYLEVVESGAHIPLVLQPELLVGRLDEASGIEPEVDMTPHGGLDGGVSRRHAKFIYEGQAWFVIDLDSTNGTSVNGNVLAPKTRTALNEGDKIEFGEVEVVFYAG